MRYLLTNDGMTPIKNNVRMLFHKTLIKSVWEENKLGAYPKEDFEKLLDHPNLLVLDTSSNPAALAKKHHVSFASTAAYLDDSADTLDMMSDKGYGLLLRSIRADTSTNQNRFILDLLMFDVQVFNALVRPFTINSFLKDNR